MAPKRCLVTYQWNYPVGLSFVGTPDLLMPQLGLGSIYFRSVSHPGKNRERKEWNRGHHINHFQVFEDVFSQKGKSYSVANSGKVYTYLYLFLNLSYVFEYFWGFFLLFWLKVLVSGNWQHWSFLPKWWSSLEELEMMMRERQCCQLSKLLKKLSSDWRKIFN